MRCLFSHRKRETDVMVFLALFEIIYTGLSHLISKHKFFETTCTILDYIVKDQIMIHHEYNVYILILKLYMSMA